MKILELFGGIGGATAALKRLGIDVEVADYVDIDKFATKSYNAINGTDFAPQDIMEWDKDLQVDLIMHGSPCQDFSVAGRGKGGDLGSGTRSSLMWQTVRIVEKLRPKYVVWENVKGVLQAKHRHNFEAYQHAMRELGYANFCQVLNAKNYGVPQNRERVFTVSILHGDPVGGFKFPEPVPLTTTLADLLEPEAPEKYYLSEKTLATFRRRNIENARRGNGFRFEPVENLAHCVSTRAGQRPTDNFIKVVGDVGESNREDVRRVYDPEGLSPTLNTMGGGGRQPKIVAMRGRNPENPSDRTSGVNTEQRLEVNQNGTSNTITTVQKDNPVMEDEAPLRIRRLTPRECWRLMGRTDEDFDKAASVNSDTQLYKQAGNSIVVDVLVAIFAQLLG